MSSRKINIWDKHWKRHEKVDIHKTLLSLIEKKSPGKKILEIGFGTGGDLVKLSKKGFDCFGIETSKIAYKRLRKNNNLHVFLQDGCNTSFNADYFDLVFHQGLMEHFRNPDILISENKRILKKRGLLIIDVPHKWNLFTIYKGVLMIMGKWYGGWETSYSANSLKKLMASNGLRVLDIRYRGIFPHRWGKIIHPTKISNRKYKQILTTKLFKYVHKIALFVYKKFKIIRLISSYNIIVIAQKI